MQRLGLCCCFAKAPIFFRKTTVRYVSSFPEKKSDPLEYLGNIILDNLQNLLLAIYFCAEHNIGSFRINSQFLPLYTHQEWGYSIDRLPQSDQIIKLFKMIKKEANGYNIRLTFHPDQFVVLNSPHEDVVQKSIAELEYHALMADLVGGDVINIHGGGSYGNKSEALCRFRENFRKLSKRAQKLLTVENDDKVFTPEDLLPLCDSLNIPLVYDVHHHRCLPDHLTIQETTNLALKTWDREPLFHISSPKDGWKGQKPERHSDFIDPKDVPKIWLKIKPLTIDIEAKEKEEAVLQLQENLIKEGWEFK